MKIELDELDLRKLTITQGRWEVRIEVEKPDGSKLVWFASADAAFTDGSAIWFGTEEEARQHMDAFR